MPLHRRFWILVFVFGERLLSISFSPELKYWLENKKGSIYSKSCVLGQVGFPRELPNRRRNGSFLLKFNMQCYQKALPDCHWVHTAILYMHRTNMSETGLGVFPDSCKRSLASFASMVSKSDNQKICGRRLYGLNDYPPYSLKAGYAAHSTNKVPQRRF